MAYSRFEVTESGNDFSVPGGVIRQSVGVVTAADDRWYWVAREGAHSHLVEFIVSAEDPAGAALHALWRARVYPAVGDAIVLPDGTSHGHRASVSQRLLHSNGVVEVWVGGFDGWDAARMAALFDRMRGMNYDRDQE